MIFSPTFIDFHAATVNCQSNNYFQPRFPTQGLPPGFSPQQFPQQFNPQQFSGIPQQGRAPFQGGFAPQQGSPNVLPGQSSKLPTRFQQAPSVDALLQSLGFNGLPTSGRLVSFFKNCANSISKRQPQI